ncbi:vWA domain-containing protein [Methylosinus sp. Sm6]|uniref:vWA domain-containing protein n=1 Tax=Methylosinus sp. Sm6 TaxID=2866948 RepID=UPI001C990FA4|nr:vWA domain-containing protein [Methylosinus sp. Sm6]MBY6240857.1 VWA domain-containing protein [Methylosinus sp. Sm6]
MRPDWRDPRLLLLLAATLLLASSFLAPQISVARVGYDALLVVDITGSMNTRDYAANGRPQSRLDAVKAALREMIAGLPCASRIALGVFSERRPFLLYEPIEVCADYAQLGGSIDALDWRMAWEGDSHVAAGLYRAIDMAKELRADVLFFTDGQEAPPLPASGGPVFDGRPGETKGLIIGVGGYRLSPIPKFNDEGREIGFYGVDDVPHENRHGLPPAGAEQREGYNARNAPFGATMTAGVEHMSSVREPYLRTLADRTGLVYTHLDGAAELARAFRSAATPRMREAALDMRPVFGASAGALLLAAFVATPLLEQRARRREIIRAANKPPERRVA